MSIIKSQDWRFRSFRTPTNQTNNSTTIVEDPYMNAYAAAYRTYRVTVYLYCISPVASDFRLALLTPVGSSGRLGITIQNGAPIMSAALDTETNCGSIGSAEFIVMHGIVRVANNDGYIRVGWGQWVAAGGDTTLYQSCVMMVEDVGIYSP